jgi:hypothetical protein
MNEWFGHERYSLLFKPEAAHYVVLSRRYKYMPATNLVGKYLVGNLVDVTCYCCYGTHAFALHVIRLSVQLLTGYLLTVNLLYVSPFAVLFYLFCVTRLRCARPATVPASLSNKRNTNKSSI